ncbi:MAG: sulfur carrier protein ThiS [Gallionella sp.]
MITVYVNGASRQLIDTCNITTLIAELGHAGRRIAVERNGDIVPRSQHSTQLLADRDKLEIIIAVGGG